MLRRALTIILTGTSIALVPVIARAQTQLSIAAARHDTLALDSSSAVTVVFRLTNTSADSVTVTPSLALPRGWERLMRAGAMRIAPGETELWIAGVHAPSGAAAGVVVVRGVAGQATDSVFVRIQERRAIELLSLDAPGWILSGAAYDARFLVRNRGNVPTSVSLVATSSRGGRPTVDMPVVSLLPGGTSTVHVHMAASSVGGKAEDDLLELVAQDQQDSRVRVTAASRTTLVPKNGGMSDNLSTIPSTLTLRAAQSGNGISLATVSGHGMIAGTKTVVDYSGYVPAKGQSPFGERDEYRLALHNDQFSARLGDGIYGFSQLTSNSALGFGAEVGGTRGLFNTAAYVQRSRWMTDAPVEAGLRFGSSNDHPVRFGVTGVGRESDGTTAGVVSFSGAAPLSRYATLSTEVAGSDSAGTSSGAERTELSGSVGGRLSYDLTSLWTGLEFAGSQRSTRGTDASLSLAATPSLSFHGYAGLHSTGSPTPTAYSPLDQYDNGTVGATFGAWGSLDYTFTSRRDVGDSVSFDGEQRGFRANVSLPVGPAMLSLNGEHGTTTERTASIARPYTALGGSFSVRLPNNGTVSVFGQHADGNGLGSDGKPSNIGGVIGIVPVGNRVQFTVTSTVSSMRRYLGQDSSTVWFGQGDARLDYRLQNETTVGLRAHYWLNPKLQGAQSSNTVYLEVRVPLGLPIGRQRRLGRVEGKVRDSNGKPLPGVLVHVGDQVGVTDEHGEVSMFGLSSGTHPISLDAGAAGAQNMLVGDATVTVDGKSDRAATFSVGVARGAHLKGRVKVMDFGTTTPDAASDSLVDAGPLRNVTIALQGARDTLYQTTNDRGQIDFGAVPPGHWTLAVLPGADLPDHHAFQNERIDLQLTPGDSRNVELRVIPRKRAVTFINGGETLKVRQQRNPE